MNTIEWSDQLPLAFEPMDKAHRAFLGHLQAAQQAPDATLAQAWSALVEQAADLFGREDEWMRKTRFAVADNHMLQHRVVLNVLREGLVMARAGELGPVRDMATELAAWFARHTQTLDATLALHLGGPRRRRAPEQSGMPLQPAAGRRGKR
jgi:hemerythrin